MMQRQDGGGCLEQSLEGDLAPHARAPRKGQFPWKISVYALRLKGEHRVWEQGLEHDVRSRANNFMIGASSAAT